MLVFDRAVVDKFAIDAARGHYRDLPLEINKRFENRLRVRRRLAKPASNSEASAMRNWPFAVVAEVGGLQNGREPEFARGRRQIFEARQPAGRA